MHIDSATATGSNTHSYDYGVVEFVETRNTCLNKLTLQDGQVTLTTGFRYKTAVDGLEDTTKTVLQ